MAQKIVCSVITTTPYLPVLELTRGGTVESIHAGAVAIVDAQGSLVAWHGDPGAITFLRSSAKPFQLLPFLEHGGQKAFRLTDQEIAVMCASHSGTDEHVEVIRSIQAKIGLHETDLMCGVHPPIDIQTAEALRSRGEEPLPNRHNCSGKHTGMLAFARLMGEPVDELPYIDPDHPIQHEILRVFAEMVDLPAEQIALGVDGCSAPNFAAPLRNVALAYARLADPDGGAVTPAARIAACRAITSSMAAYPFMVGGADRFDTRLMEAGKGRFIAKGGAEAFQGIGLMSGALGHDSAALGIAIKIADGDARNKVCPAVALETLRQLGAFSPTDLECLAEFGPQFPILNWRKILAGEAHPTFMLNWVQRQKYQV